ncbi:CPBP family intramembrane glutamic endopeptidase [Chryseobacterium sp.]|uniref:CPBP family intramembrane glutamic endopeptidase n=1 Tax=Chryseobacterium sp. TaxID=1871047 RepID=UPI0033425061
MNTNLRFFSIFITGFILYYLFDLYCFKSIQTFAKGVFHSKAAAHVITYMITSIPLVITAKVLLPKEDIVQVFSLNQSLSKGFMVSFSGTLPMLIGYSFFFGLTQQLDFESLFINTISSAFFEEIIFRAFLIGIVYRFTRLGFLTSIVLASLLFAQAHLYQSQNSIELIEIFSVTFLGSVLFAWLYSEWNFNIWAPIFLHFFMNLYWNIFDVSDNAAGNNIANIFRFSSIILTILITVYYKRKYKIPFQITGKSLFMKSREAQS